MANETTVEIGGAVVTLTLADVARLRYMVAKFRKAEQDAASTQTALERLRTERALIQAQAALSDFSLEIFAGLEP